MQWGLLSLLLDGIIVEAFGSRHEYELYCGRQRNAKYGARHRKRIRERSRRRYYANHTESKRLKRDDQRRRMLDSEYRKRACEQTKKSYRKMRLDPVRLAAYNRTANQIQRRKYREDPEFRARVKRDHQKRMAAIKADPKRYADYLHRARVTCYKQKYGDLWRVAMMNTKITRTPEVRDAKKKKSSKEGNKKRKIKSQAYR